MKTASAFAAGLLLGILLTGVGLHHWAEQQAADDLAAAINNAVREKPGMLLMPLVREAQQSEARRLVAEQRGD